jgi:hypothetical protein
MPGTVNAAIVGYYQCLAFRELAPSTQARRRAILERFRNEHGDKRIATLPQEFIRRVLDRMKPGKARNWLKALGGLLDFAVGQNFRADNPARGSKPARVRTERVSTVVTVSVKLRGRDEINSQANQIVI